MSDAAIAAVTELVGGFGTARPQQQQQQKGASHNKNNGEEEEEEMEDVAVSEGDANHVGDVDGAIGDGEGDEDDEAHEADLAAKAEKMKDYVSVVEQGDKKSWVSE